ncbi:hypothetical protein ACTXJY_00330 [Corynebacterium casei]|uniref:hypothetical protein n=1 Tax=Corynebacterium casei TaxID=160386 RepID=UPI003FD57E81
MPTDFVIGLLKKWRAGKKLTKSQYAELANDGLLIELEPDVYELSKHGSLTLKNNQ